MGKGKGRKNRNKENPDAFEQNTPADSGNLDPSVLASVLASEYPLIDSSLVLALVSDYDPSTLNQHLDEIREQLGILEATSVPDLEDAHRAPTPALSASEPHFPPLNSSSISTSTDVTSFAPDDEDETNPQTEAELLAVFFPKLRKRDIEDALSTEPTLDAAIDHLLSVELIRGVQRTGVWPDEPPEEEDEGEWVVPSRRGSGASNTAASTPPISQPQSRPSSAAATQSPSLPRAKIPPAIPPAATGKGKKPTLTIPIVDTLQRRASPLVSPSPSGSSSRRSHSPSGPSSDVWAAFSSLAAFLAETVPRAPSTFFISYLHSPDYLSAHEAVLAALGSLATTASDSDTPPDAVNVLEAMYNVSLDDEEASRNLHLCLRATEGDIGAVMDLMDTIIELTWWPDYEAAKERERDPWELIAELGSSLPSSRADSRPDSRASSRMSSTSNTRPSTPSIPVQAQVQTTRAVNPNRLTRPPPPLTAVQKAKAVKEKGVPGSRPPTSAYTAPHDLDTIPTSARWTVHSTTQSKPKSNGHVLNWRTVAPAKKRTQRPAHPLAASIPAYARGELPNRSSLSPSDCYARGEMEWEKRVSAIRTAAQHFGTGGRKDIAAMKAGYYAAEARRATAAARQWELEGARIVVDAQLARTSNTVDLHYATVDQAITLALETAEQWWSNSERSHRLTVITGKGKHSAGKRGVLGPAVARALEDNGWRVQRGDGHVAILGR